MAMFVGTSKEFNTFIGPRLRNVVNTMSKKSKAEAGHICQHCGGHFSTLDAAHVHGKERTEIIRQILKPYDQGHYYIIPDLEVFEDEFRSAHEPLDETFLFLCHECHRKYDNSPKERADSIAAESVER